MLDHVDIETTPSTATRMPDYLLRPSTSPQRPSAKDR